MNNSNWKIQLEEKGAEETTIIIETRVTVIEKLAIHRENIVSDWMSLEKDSASSSCCDKISQHPVYELHVNYTSMQ